MAIDFKAIIPAVLIMAVHFFCFILWIAGWAASKQMDTHSGVVPDPAYPNRYYFTWGFLVSLATLVAIICSLIPVPLVRKGALLALVYFIVVMAIPLSVVMGISGQQLGIAGCGDLTDGPSKDMCNGYKTLFVSTFCFMLALGAEVIYVILMWQRESQRDNYGQTYEQT